MTFSLAVMAAAGQWQQAGSPPHLPKDLPLVALLEDAVVTLQEVAVDSVAPTAAAPIGQAAATTAPVSVGV